MGNCCQTEKSKKEAYLAILSDSFGLVPERNLQMLEVDPVMIVKIIKAQSLFRGYIGRQKVKNIKNIKMSKGRGLGFQSKRKVNSERVSLVKEIRDNKEHQEEKQREHIYTKLLKGYGNEVPEGKNLSYDKEGMWKGTFSWKDGSIYNGQFKNSSINGLGTYSWRDGRKYSGEWMTNKMQGYGIYTWPDGRMYEGEYWQDNKHGEGAFTWPEGKKYIGAWANGMQHGEGILIGSNGKERRGKWKEGKLFMWL